MPRKISYIVLLVLVLSLFPSQVLADIDDNSGDYNAVIDRVTDLQTNDPSLPSVAEPKGRVGFILSRIFNASGQISNAVLKPFAVTSRGSSNDKLLRWSGGNGGNFVDSIIYDTGTNIGIGATPSTTTLALDVSGNVGANEYCDQEGNNCFSPSAVSTSGGGTIGGTGTPDTIARFTGPNSLGDSLLQDNGAQLTTNNIFNANAGVRVDGRAAISGSNTAHTVQYTDDTRYGFFEVRNNSNQRGAFFGWGNGGSTVDLNLETANTLNILGGTVALGTEGTAANHLVTKGYVDSVVSSGGSPWIESGGNVHRASGNVGIGTISASNTRLRISQSSPGSFDSANVTSHLELLGDASTAPAITFHRAGAYAFKIGQDLAGNFAIGGWSKPTRQFVLSPSGNIGIGTTAPVGKLNISGFTDASLTSTTHALTLGDTGGINIIADNNEIMARNNGAVSTLHLNADGGDVSIGGSSTFRVLNNGNVGIGTSAPTSKLQIGSNTPNAANYITFGERVSSAESNLPFIGQTNITGTEQSLGLGSRSTGGGIGFFAGPSTPFFNNNLLRMFISPSGNVGIGTNAPAEALHVVGEVQLNREGSIYDVWIQGEGPVGSTRPRNLALLGVEGSDRLYLNFNNEYSGGTNVGSVHFRTTEIDNVTCVGNCF